MSGLFGGNNAASQQGTAWSNLNTLFNTSQNAATGFGTQGTSALNQSQDYFQTLLGGNRTATAEAVAPAADAATSAAAAQKKQLADMGTGRTGGAVATSQQLDDSTRAQIDTLIGGAAPAAATSLAGIGSTDIGGMLSALGIGEGSASTLGAQATNQYQYSDTAATNAGKSAAELGLIALLAA